MLSLNTSPTRIFHGLIYVLENTYLIWMWTDTDIIMANTAIIAGHITNTR